MKNSRLTVRIRAIPILGKQAHKHINIYYLMHDLKNVQQELYL